MFSSNRKKIIEKSFGQNPNEGNFYYNAERRLKDVRIMHDDTEEKPETGWAIDDITWEDLEMDKVFLRVNHTNSFVGEQYLYHRLHILDGGVNNQLSEGQISDKMESRITFLDKNPRVRLDIEDKLNNIGKHEDAYQITNFLLNTDMWKIGNTVIYHILQAIFIALVVCLIIFHNTVFIVAAITSALVNLTFYIILKRKYDMYMCSLADFKRIYDFAYWMLKHDRSGGLYESTEIKNSLKRLAVMSGILVGLNNRRQSTMTGDVIGMFFDYVWGILLVDVSVFNYIMKKICNNIDDVFNIIDYVGEIDSEISILSYRKSVEEWCYPEYVERGIVTENVVHPLLSAPVGNSFEFSDRIVITGANASGKSTFMKSVAINCILAQSINTCTAKTMKLQPMQISTCMSLRDDILSGESYYFREAKYLKRMLDEINTEPSIMLVIDEILKGTNTTERVAASKAIMEYISKRNCLAMLATHDNELTENELYKNYYFTSRMIENDICFDYILHEGTCEETNAIALLDFLGYPKEIIAEARNNVKES